MTNQKIYYVANAKMPTPKAHGIQLAKMAEAMVLAGADLKLVLPARRTGRRSIKEFYGLRADIPYVKIPVLDLYGFGRLGFFAGSVFFMIGSFLYLFYKKISGENFIIYVIDMDLFSFFLLPFLGRSLFAEIHDAKPATLAHKILFSRAKGIIAINGIIKEEISERFGISADRITVHPNGIDLKEFRADTAKEKARETLGISEGRKIALYSGKLYEWKGLEILFEAAGRLQPEIFVYWVGGSDEDCKKISGSSAVPANMICAGEKQYKEMPVWLSAADILLVLGTKKNDYSYLHTSPMKLMEYMAAGRPIVASRTPANSEIISEKEVFFYEPDSADALASKIKEAIASPETGQKVRSARGKAEGLSWQKRAEAVLRFIQDQG